MLDAMIVFYLVANLFVPLGQIGFFNEWVCRNYPLFFIAILLLVFF